MGYGPRPTGVTILAVLTALLAILFLITLLGSLALLAFSGNSQIIQSLRNAGAPQWIIDNIQTIGAVLTVVSLIFFVLAVLLAYGFTKGSRWAWGLGIVVMVLNIISTVVQFIALPGTSDVFGAAISIVIPLLIIFYLTTPRVKAFFYGPAPGQPMPPPYGGQV